MTGMTALQISSGFFNRLGAAVQRHWLLMLNIFMGIFVSVPFLAPVFMRVGAFTPANIVYTVYSTQCHQLPQRSYFLFGEQLTYSLPEINAARGSQNTWTLRQFVGNEQMGWKVAWSDRMISLYTSIFMGSVVYAALRKRMRPLPILIAALLILPMAIDGTSHVISDLAGIGQGFRDTNEWLRALTGNAFPDGFYAGDRWGSFNSLMRLVTGVMAGYAIAWLVLPHVNRWMPKP